MQATQSTSQAGERTHQFNVGDKATICFYSDCRTGTVIKVTAQSVTIQEDKPTLLNGINSGEPDALQFSAGGFCGHTSGKQRWNLERDETGTIHTARVGKKGLRTPGKNKVIAGSHHFYDFNF